MYVCMYVCIYVYFNMYYINMILDLCMYVYFYEWTSNRVLDRLGLDTLIGWSCFICMYVFMYVLVPEVVSIYLPTNEAAKASRANACRGSLLGGWGSSCSERR